MTLDKNSESRIRADLNRWVGLACFVTSTVGVLAAWGEPQFWTLVMLWCLVGGCGSILGRMWQRPDADPDRLILLSTSTFVPLCALMVVFDGGVESSLWLVLFIGALSSAFSASPMARIAFGVSLTGTALAMAGPPLVLGTLGTGKMFVVVNRCAALALVWLMTHRIVLSRMRESEARLLSEQNERRLLLETVALRERNQEQQKMEALGRLAGGVAHDFNNLLTVILGVAKGLERSVTPSSEVAEDVEDLVAAGQQAAALTQQLLRYSRGGVRPFQELVDISVLVKDTSRMLARVFPPDILLVTDVDIEDANVLADRNELSRVLMNLGLNARDAIGKEGEVMLVVRHVVVEDGPGTISEPVAPGSYIEVTVKDDGAGMSEDVRQRAFEPFFTTKEVGRGTGIGLASAYSAVHRLGGSLSLQSEEGWGTLARVLLPHHQLADGEGVVEGVIPVPSAAASPTERPVRPMVQHVVVVDDEPGVRRVVTRLLRSVGYTVTDFENPLEFYEQAIGALEYDALVTDINMPGMSGIDLVRRLEKSRVVRPTLFISGYFSQDLDLQEFDTDCYGFLEKPLGASSLDDALRDCIERFEFAFSEELA